MLTLLGAAFDPATMHSIHQTVQVLDLLSLWRFAYLCPSAQVITLIIVLLDIRLVRKSQYWILFSFCQSYSPYQFTRSQVSIYLIG